MSVPQSKSYIRIEAEAIRLSSCPVNSCEGKLKRERADSWLTLFSCESCGLRGGIIYGDRMGGALDEIRIYLGEYEKEVGDEWTK